MSPLRVTARIVIGEEELEERFIQASGPGGQNVNKVATAVQLRFDVGATRAFDEEVKRRLKTLAGRRLGKDGVLTIEAKRYRSQERNRADARQRLIELVRRAAAPVRPRKATRPTLASKQRRLETKKARSAIKRARGRPADD